MFGRLFPFVSWLKGYHRKHLRADLVAGLTVALVLIPQSMAYAQLAGLPAFYGLYAALIPPIIASLYGSSRQLATGPVAVVSLITFASLAPLAPPGSERFVALAILLSFLVGIVQLALGVFRLGLVVNFLSHPVVNGFTNAAALIIATSQLSKLLGVNVDTAEHHYETIARVVAEAAHFIHWPTLLLGILAFAIMVTMKRLLPRAPNVLAAVVVTTVVSWAVGFQHNLKLPVQAIQDEAVQSSIAHFNELLGQQAALSKERTALSAELEAKKSSPDALAHLELQHQDDVLALRISLLDEEVSKSRAELRRLQFSRVSTPTSDGMVTSTALGAREAADARVWRLKVGTGALKADALTFIGGGEVLGTIPSGLPALAVPKLDLPTILRLLPFAAIISFLGFMEAISIAKAMAARTGQRLDPNQELIGQGLANLLGAFGSSYPTSGSFSRSAVNLQAGAVTGLSNVFGSLTVLVMLLFLTPLLYHLPQSVLAAVIMMAVAGLLNVSGFVHAWKAQKGDGIISVISFVSTLFFAPHLDKGILIGVVLSLLLYLYKGMRPKVAVLARHEDRALRSAEHHGLSECQYISLIRFDGPLFFANASYLEDQIMERMKARKQLRHIVVVANGINDMDASGEEAFSLLVDRVRSAGLDLSISGVNEDVMEVLTRTHLDAKIGSDHIYPTMELAIEAIHAMTHEGTEEEDCPLKTVRRIPKPTAEKGKVRYARS